MTCPECGGVLQLVTDGAIEVPYAPAFHRRDHPIPTQLVDRPFWACTACEHCRPASRDALRVR